MQKQILILAMVLLAVSTQAQVSRGSSIVSANGNLSYTPPSSNDVKVNGSGKIPVDDNKSFSGAGSLSFGWFVKENRSVAFGCYGNYSSINSSSQYAYDNSSYSTSENYQKGSESGFIIGTQKFYPVWKDRFFVTVNTDLSFGYLNAETRYEYSYVGNDIQTRKDSYKSNGLVSKFTIGTGAYFFVNKHWGLTSRVTIINLQHKHLSNTTSSSLAERSSPFSTAETTSVVAKNVTNTFDASFNPFVRPFSLVWGVSYFF